MIKKIEINLENCYGIKQLKHDFSFREYCNTHLIYAPNGTMKTSFAKTMKFLSGQSKCQPCDQLHHDKSSKYELKINDGEIGDVGIYVVNGEDDIDSSKSFINFLASAGLKDRYDEVYKKLTEKKDLFITALKKCSQSTDCEKEILEAFAQKEDDTIFNVLEGIESKIKEGLPIFEFKYNDIFDKKGVVKDFLDKYRDNLKKYIANYERLLNSSTFYRSIGKFSFGTYQATQLAQCVSDGVFFGVDHKIVLQNGEEVTSHEQLEKIILNEQKRILDDEELKKLFEKITKAIDKNSELRGFKNVIEKNPEWIPEIVDYENFRQKVWLGYLAKPEVKGLFDSYMGTYKDNKNILIEILNEADAEQDKWRNIIDLYNARFHVPIKVSIINQKDVILRKEAAKLQFSYAEEGEDPIIKEKQELDNILSRGEKRAFIILQFLFEIEGRKANNRDTILIMDDIADSFDYQNKYAIIEYIKDLEVESSRNFYMLILTHNYDFYRTVSSRLNIPRQNLWMVERLIDGHIHLNKGQYKGNVYSNVFVENNDNDKIFISMIPFVRNLIEYTKGVGAEEYIVLTNCLHKKNKTKDISEYQVIDIMKHYTMGKSMKRKGSENKIYDLIMKTADSIANESSLDTVKIENKIVLSIAIRHMAENYIYEKVLESGKDEKYLEVTSNQTGQWTRKYKEVCPFDDNKGIIERVNMMTPELIHINSFMFEPLIDMSIHHLVKLYRDCKEKLRSI